MSEYGHVKPLVCDYCGGPAPCVSSRAAYPHRPDLWHKPMYRCDSCDAHVGCHPGGTQPLGRLANAQLRRAKMAAHAAFDPLWQNGAGKRSALYGWLANQLNIPKQKCHIGMFDEAMCERVVAACEEFRRD